MFWGHLLMTDEVQKQPRPRHGSGLSTGFAFVSKKVRCLLPFFALIAAFGAPRVEAAIVKKLNVKKLQVLVELDSAEEFQQGSSVCIFDKGGKKIDCGSVAKVKGTQALVKFTNKSKFKRLKPGMKVTSSGDDGDQDPSKSDGGKSDGDDSGENPAEKTSNSKKTPKRLWLSWTPFLASPTTFAKLAYKAPTTSTPTTLWDGTKKTTSSLFSFGASGGFPVGSGSLTAGVRYTKYSDNQIDSDYVQQANPYARTLVAATGFGLDIGYQFYRVNLSPALSAAFGSSLDIDQSSVSVTATKKDDTGANPDSTIAKASSKLTVISLRLDASLDYMFSKVAGVNAGLALLLPAASSGATFSSNFGDGESRGLETDPQTDMKAALNHKKGGIAAGLVLGLLFAF